MLSREESPQNPHESFIKVRSHGGFIENVTLQGQKIWTAVMRGDGKEGATHICVPNFGRRDKPMGLSHHGPWREMDLKELSAEEGRSSILEGEINEGEYTNVHCIQTTTVIDDTFTLTIDLTNESQSERPANLGVHGYFDTENGWEGTKINGREITAGMLDGRTNKPGTVILDLKINNTIQIPGKKPLVLEVDGFKKAVVWVYQKLNGDQPPTFDQNYICIEPIEDIPESFGRPESQIPPGGSRTVTMSLKIAE